MESLAANLDFFSSSSELLLNPRLSAEDRKNLEERWSHCEQPPGHLWLATSGSTGRKKLVALSKAGFLASAQAVNDHLHSTARDRWALSIPDFHVGGLAIWARARLSGAHVLRPPGAWKAKSFVDFCEESQITLCSLVPTQIYDLIRASLKAPPTLTAVVVGGGALGPNLYKLARELRWPVLPSYGLTEASSQVATAGLESLREDPEKFPPLEILSHVEIDLRPGAGEPVLALRGPSLLTGYAPEESLGLGQLFDPKDREGWLLTEDHGRLIGGRHLEILGRGQDFVKISGESVDLAQLNHRLRELSLAQDFPAEACLVALPDERLGHVLELVVEGEGLSATLSAQKLFRLYNTKVAPFEKARAIHMVAKLPRTDSGKLRRADVHRLLTNQTLLVGE